MSKPAGITVDELARRTELPTSTLRMYQAKGLLHAPRRSGRSAFYDESHLARVRLIGELQGRGFSLAGIKQLLDEWENGRGLDDVLGLEREATVPLAREEPIRVSLPELAQRFAGLELTQELLQRCVALGLVRFEGIDVVVQSPAFLEIGSALGAMGVPLERIIDEYEILLDQSNTIASRFIGVFQDSMWKPFVDDGLPAEKIPELTTILERLVPIARETVVLTFNIAMQRVAASFIAGQAEQFGRPDLLDAIEE